MCRILGDQDTYGELSNNTTLKFKRDLSDLITRGFDEHILDKKEKA